ncbi:MAG: sensor histidine kinase, partial [Desulforhopalus sp.]
LSVFNIEQQDLINEKLLRFSQSEKLTSMGILAAGIAHEINNPLTNVQLNVEMLRDHIGIDEISHRRLSAIDRNLDRASEIAKELLHFSREKETDLIPVQIHEILESTKNLLKNQTLSSILQFNLQDVPSIYGIPWKLEEVFVNILMNSFDACTEEDSIEIASWHHKDRVVVEITDTGHGINDASFNKVFDPFYTTKDVGKGTGLGLSVSYNIIKQHEGDITLLSSENGGTIVTISFPVIHDEK